MNITVTDTALLTPTGGIASNTPIKIVCLEGYDQVLTGAISEFTTDDAGAYSFPLYYGVHAIYVRFDTKFKLLGKVTITSELADTATISDLLLYTEPMLPDEIALVSGLVEEARGYAEDAETAKDDVDNSLATLPYFFSNTEDMLAADFLVAGRIVSSGQTEWTVTEDNPSTLDGFRPNGNVYAKDFGWIDGSDNTAVANAAVAYTSQLESDLVGHSVAALVFTGEWIVSSVDFTNLRNSFNFNILCWGAVFYGNTADKVIIDCTGSRFLWFYGLVTWGDEAILPRCGVQLGNSDEVPTNGNSKFFSCQTLGYYGESGFQNYGSETTQYYSCRFYNNNSDAEKFAFIGDGKANRSYTSDYATVSPTQAASSFTNNYFYSCQFRSENGGKAAYLAQTNGWTFDRGCYFLSYTDAPMTIYTASSARNTGLDIGGLFETAQDPGLPYLIKFVGDGTGSTLRQINLRLRNVNANVSIFHNESAGNVEMSGSIDASGFKYSGVTFFGVSGNMSGEGLNLTTTEDDRINLADLTSYYGRVQCNSIDTITYPTTGKAYVFDNSGVSITPESKITLSSGWQVRAVTDGAISVDSKFNTISTSNAVITDIEKAYDGTMEIVIRNSTNTDVTITYDTSKIRLNSKSDVTLSQHQTIRLANVTGSIWQEV